MELFDYDGDSGEGTSVAMVARLLAGEISSQLACSADRRYFAAWVPVEVVHRTVERTHTASVSV